MFSGAEAAKNIGGTAMWNGHECIDVQYPWPHMFSELGDEYDRRYGLKQEHLARIAEINFANAKRNPNSQTRKWQFTEDSFLENDQANPVIEGRIRKTGLWPNYRWGSNCLSGVCQTGERICRAPRDLTGLNPVHQGLGSFYGADRIPRQD
jgi:hypothetical protein